MLIAIYLGSGVFVVQDGHVGVVSQFGQYRQTVSQGIHWRLPYPFQSSEIVDTSQIRSVEVGRGTALSQGNVRDASLLTNDADIVDVRFAVQYQIKSAKDFLFRSVNADDSVTQAAQSAIREIAGSISTDDMLYKDREALRSRLIETIQRSLDSYHTGLQVTGVAVQSVQVPQQVQSAFEEAARVRQDNERARDTAQAYADQLLPRAKADAAKLIDEARLTAIAKSRRRRATRSVSRRSTRNTRRRPPSSVNVCTWTPCSKSTRALQRCSSTARPAITWCICRSTNSSKPIVSRRRNRRTRAAVRLRRLHRPRRKRLRRARRPRRAHRRRPRSRPPRGKGRERGQRRERQCRRRLGAFARCVRSRSRQDDLQ